MPQSVTSLWFHSLASTEVLPILPRRGDILETITTGVMEGTDLETAPTERPMQPEGAATSWRESDTPNERGVPWIRADARKRRAQDEKIERRRTIALRFLQPVPCLRITQAGVD